MSAGQGVRRLARAGDAAARRVMPGHASLQLAGFRLSCCRTHHAQLAASSKAAEHAFLPGNGGGANPQRRFCRRGRRARTPPSPPAALPGAAAAVSLATASLEGAVLSASALTSFKLLFVCALVAWMRATGRLPRDTSRILSQVAFNLTIPSLLLVSTATTLARSRDVALLALPAAAVAHIAVGAALGTAGAALVEGRSALGRRLLGWGSLDPTPQAAAIAATTAAAIGAPAAAAALLPRTSSAPRGLGVLVQASCAFGNALTLPLLYLLTLLGSGGGTAAGEVAGRTAAAYVSLYHAAWSPLLWSVGYGLLRAAATASDEDEDGGGKQQRSRWRGRRHGLLSRARVWWGRVRPGPPRDEPPTAASKASPPVQVLMTRQLPPAPAPPGSSSSRAVPVYAAADEPGGGEAGGDRGSSSSERGGAAASFSWAPHDDETPAEALLRVTWGAASRAWAATAGALQAQFGGVINPPLLAALAGVVIGLSPVGPVLTSRAAASAAAAAAAHESTWAAWELGVALTAARGVWEVFEMLAGATLALQAVVLAASLFTPAAAGSRGGADDSGGDADARQAAADAAAAGTSSIEVEQGGGGSVTIISGGAGGDALVPRGGGGGASAPSSSSSSPAAGITLTAPGAANADEASASVLAQLLPRGAWEWRTLAVVAVVRFVLLPLLSTAALLALARANLVPISAFAADPLVVLVILLQAAMPPAQNLALMMQLQPETAGLAPAASRLMVQLYALAVLPVTLWLALFAGLSGVIIGAA